MEPNFKLSRRQKTSLITRYLRHCWQYFVIGLVCACLGMTLNALTPQIIKITVDSILGEEATTLPLWVQNVIGWESLQQQPVRALWYAAVGVLLVALLRGVCSFGQRLYLAKGSESYVKAIRDDLYRHIQHLSFAWH